MFSQYFRWVGAILFEGSLGKSLWQNTPVDGEILHRLPLTFELGLMALIVALIVAIPIGVYSAMRQDTVGDYVARSFAIPDAGAAELLVGTLVMVFPSIWWGWSPDVKLTPFTGSAAPDGPDLIPAMILGKRLSAVVMRLTRTMMLEVMRQDYIRTAWAWRRAHRWWCGHALRNALIPVVTLVGLQAQCCSAARRHPGADLRHPRHGPAAARRSASATIRSSPACS